MDIISNDVVINFNSAQEEDFLQFMMVATDGQLDTCVQGRIDILYSYISTNNKYSKKQFIYPDNEYRLRWFTRRNGAT